MPDNWLKNIQRALLAPRCTICRAPAPLALAVCTPCAAELPWLVHQCRHCALGLAQPGIEVCAHCRRRPRFDFARAALHYRAPVRELVAELKFAHRIDRARLLGGLLAERLAAVEPPQALIPVPLHPAGLRRRGFNQAERIARACAARRGWTVDDRRVERVTAGQRQSELSRSERLTNVARAFACERPLPYRHVAIVDDVVTTGATAAALARCLRRAGAERVDLYAVARA